MSTTDIVLVVIIIISSTCFGYRFGTKVGYRKAISLFLKMSIAASNAKAKEERKDND